MVDFVPHCCRRRGKASASLRSEQVGVADDLGALRHFYVLDHPEGPSALRTHLRPTFPIELIITDTDNTANKRTSSLTIDIHTDTITLTMNKSITPYLIFSMSHGPTPTSIIKESYFEGDNKLLKVTGVGKKESGFLCCKGVNEEEFTVELFFATPLMRDYVASVMSGLGHQDSSAALAAKAVSPVQSLKIFVGSWNFGNNVPPSNLEPWIPRGRFDLYAIGMQESPGENIKLIINYMGDEYVSIKDEVMGVIRLIVLIRKSMVQFVAPDSVESFHVASGILGGMGINKGGVGVALRYRNTPIAFVASHLAARATAKRNRRRNKDVRTIVEKMSFGLGNVDVLHQYNLFWLGDLNYRITLPWEETVSLIKQKKWETLRRHDQLLIEKAAGRVFYGYNELPLDFPPTYKYIDFKNTAEWDPLRKNGRLIGHICRTEAATAQSREHAAKLQVEEGDTHFFLPADASGLRREYTRHKMQTPSWTDRILHKPLPGVVVTQESVGCADEIQTSDHTPIFSTFNMRVPLPPPADVKFLKCTIHVSNVSLSNPRLAGEGYGGEDEYYEEEDDEEDDEDDSTTGKSAEKQANQNNNSGAAVVDSGGGGNTGGGSNAAATAASGAPKFPQTKIPKIKKSNSKKHKRDRSRTKKEMGRRSVFGKEQKLSPVLAMHLPFLRHITKRTAYKTSSNAATSSTISAKRMSMTSTGSDKMSVPAGQGEGRSFTWHQGDIPVMGPFFTKMEYLEHRHIIFRVQGNAGHGAAGNTIGYCTVSLKEMMEKRRPVAFECTLLRGGQPAGVLKGDILIKWLDGGNNVISGHRSVHSVGESKTNHASGEKSKMVSRIQMVRNPSANIDVVKRNKNKVGGHESSRSIQMSASELAAANR